MTGKAHQFGQCSDSEVQGTGCPVVEKFSRIQVHLGRAMSWFHAVANHPTRMLLRQRTGHSDFAGVSSAAFARRLMLVV